MDNIYWIVKQVWSNTHLSWIYWGIAKWDMSKESAEEECKKLQIRYNTYAAKEPRIMEHIRYITGKQPVCNGEDTPIYRVEEHFSNPFHFEFAHDRVFIRLFKNDRLIASVSYSAGSVYESNVAYQELEQRFNIKIPRPYNGSITF